MIARALLLLCWTFAAIADDRVPALSDFLKAQIQPRFPAPIETLQCDPGNAPRFQCRGRLIDGRLVQVEAKRGADGAITITDLVHHVPAAQSMREFLQPLLHPPLATIDCPPEQPTLGAIECRGTLTDGTRFTVAGNRRRDFALEVGPVTYDSPVRVERNLRTGAAAAAIIGPLLAIIGAIQLVRLHKRNFITRVPLTPDQQLLLDEPGDYVMMAEGPRFTFAWRGLQFSLRHAATGADVPLYVDVLRVRVSGVSRVRRSYRRFTITEPGTYVLHLLTDPAGRDLSELTAYFARSFFFAGLLWVGLIVGGAMLFLAGLLLSLG